VINYIKTSGKFPSYTEALHLFDLQNQIKYSSILIASENVGKKRLVYIDITEFVKQGFQTGIQRVVNAFIQYAPNGKFIFFKNGSYYEFKYLDLPKLQKRRNIIRYLERIYKFFYIKTYSNIFKKSSKSMRNKVFDYLYLGVKKIDIEDLLSANLFIPDLPSERSHLEAILCLGSFTNINLSVFVHDLIPIINPELMPENSTNEFNLYAKILLTADKIFCASNIVKTKYLGYRKMQGEFKGKQRIYVRSFPQFIQSENAELQIVSEKFRKLLGNTDYILAVGTIFPRKNLSLLVRALKILENSNIYCNLVVLAHSNWQDRGFDLACKSLSFNKVLIYYNSNDAELIYAYKNSLALGFPSLAEGFGLPVVESLSYDKITIINSIEPMKSLSSSKNLRKLDNRAVSWAKEITSIIDTKNKSKKSESKEVINKGSKNLLKLKEKEWVQDLFSLFLN
jgi:glycosyltransferase involved in cell wall biosynthesis